MSVLTICLATLPDDDVIIAQLLLICSSEQVPFRFAINGPEVSVDSLVVDVE